MSAFSTLFYNESEVRYFQKCIESGSGGGNGLFTKFCQILYDLGYGYPKSLMTRPCTNAMEMCALLLDLKLGDEVIVPLNTFFPVLWLLFKQWH